MKAVILNEILRDIAISIGGGIVTFLITTHIAQSLIVIAILLWIIFSFENLRRWNMTKKRGIERVFSNSPKHTADATKYLDTCSKTIRILTFSGLTRWSELNNKFEDIVSKKRIEDVRVLVLDPHSKYVRVRAEELYQPQEAMKADIESARNRLLELKKTFGIKVREYDDLPMFRIIFIDDTLFLGLYSKGKSVEDSTAYKIAASSQLFEVFDKYFDHIWNNKAKELERNDSI